MNQKKTGSILAVVLLLAVITGCSDSNNRSAGSGPAVGFVVTTDVNFSVGNLSTITTTAPRTTRKDVLGSTGVHSDAVTRTFGGLIFIIQRLGANSIIVLDPENPSASIANYTTNDAHAPDKQSDPHDMAFVSLSKAYVSRYGLNTILIVNPRTGEHLDTIDLSQFADSDGIVEMDHMVIVNGKLYIALQRLDSTQPFGKQAVFTSFVVVVDTTTDEVVDVDLTSNGIQAIELKGKNPFGHMVFLPDSNRIYLAHAGNFFAGQSIGGIEAINPDNNTSEGIIIPDTDFGNAIGTFAILSETIAYATVFDTSLNVNVVIPFDLTIRKVATDSPLNGIGTGFIMSLAFDPDGFLYVADRDTTNPGIQIFDTTTNQKVEGPIDTGLPPSDIVFVTP